MHSSDSDEILSKVGILVCFEERRYTTRATTQNKTGDDETRKAMTRLGNEVG